METSIEKLKTGEASLIRQGAKGLAQVLVQTCHLEQQVKSHQAYATLCTHVKQNTNVALVSSCLQGLFEIYEKQPKLLNATDLMQFVVQQAATAPLHFLSHYFQIILDILQQEPKKSNLDVKMITSLLQNRPESIAEFISQAGPLSHVLLKRLAPVFAMLLAYKHPQQGYAFRTMLIRELSNFSMFFSKLEASTSVTLFLFHFLPSFEWDDDDIHTSCLHPCSAIVSLIVNKFEGAGKLQQTVLSLLLHHLFSLYGEWKAIQAPVSWILSQIAVIFEHFPTIAVSFAPLLCKYIMLSETQMEQTILISLLSQCIELVLANKDVKNILFDEHVDHAKSVYAILHFCVAPLLQVVSTSAEDLTRSKATVLLNKIETFVNKQPVIESPTPNTSSDTKEIGHLKSIQGLFVRHDGVWLKAFYSTYVPKFFIEPFELDATFATEWSNTLVREAQFNSEFMQRFGNPELFYLFVAVVFLKSRSYDQARTNCLQLLQHLCGKNQPLRASLLIQPLVLYELSREEDARLKLEMLYALPKLGTTHFVCVTSVVKFLTSLLQSASMVPIVIRLFTDLWLENERFFPRLKTTLVQYSKYKTPQEDEVLEDVDLTDFNIEVRLAIASSMLSICDKSAEKGLEMVQLLSKVLTQDDHPSVLVLGLRAISKLFKSDALDFYTAWFQIIASNVQKHADKYPQVLVEVCNLFQFGVILDDGMSGKTQLEEFDIYSDYSHESREETRELILQLWEYAKHESEQVRIAAYSVLAKFPIKAHLYAITEETSDNEEQAESESNEQDQEKVKTEDDLFTVIQKRKEVLVTLSKLLIAQIEQEESNVVRNSMNAFCAQVLRAELVKVRTTSKLEANAEPSSKDSNVAFLMKQTGKYIASEYEGKANTQRVVSAAMLFAGSPTVTQARVKSNVDYYRRLFKDLVKDTSSGAASDDFYFRFVMSQGFFSIVNRYFAEQVAEESNKETAFSAAFEKIYPELKAKVETTSGVPSEIENTVLSIGALCMSLPSTHSHHHIENVVQLIKKLLSAADVQESMVYVADLALACAAFELLHVATQLSEIVALLLNQVKSLQKADSNASAAACLAVGLIAQKLCQGESVDSVIEKQLLLDIANALLQVIQVNNTMLDWKQYTCVSIGLGMTIDSLAKAGESAFLHTLYPIVQAQLEKTKEVATNDKEVANSALLSSIALTVPQLVSVMYKNDLITQEQVHPWLDSIWSMVQSTENKKLPVFTELYRNSSIAFASLVFELISHNYELSVETWSSYVTYFVQVAVKQANASTKLSALFALGTLFGASVTTPVPDTFGEESDEHFVHKTLFASSLHNANVKPVIQSTIETLQKMYQNATVDAKVKKTCLAIVGHIVETYRQSENVDAAPVASASKKTDSVRIPCKILADEGLSMYFVNVLHQQDADYKVQIALGSFLQSINLPRIPWSQLLTKWMKYSDLQITCLHMLCKEATSALSAANARKVLSNLCEKAKFVQLEPALQQAIVERLSDIAILFPASRSIKIISDISTSVQSDALKVAFFDAIGKILVGLPPQSPLADQLQALLHAMLLKMEIPFTVTSPFIQVNHDAFKVIQALATTAQKSPSKWLDNISLHDDRVLLVRSLINRSSKTDANMNLLKSIRQACLQSKDSDKQYILSCLAVQSIQTKTGFTQYCEETIDLTAYLLAQKNPDANNGWRLLSQLLSSWLFADMYTLGNDLLLQYTTNCKIWQPQLAHNTILATVLSKAMSQNELNSNMETMLLTRLLEESAEQLREEFVMPLLASTRKNQLVKKSWNNLNQFVQKFAKKFI